MANYQRKQVKPPPALLYGLCRWLVRFFCRFFLGLRVRYVDSVPKTGPLMVLGAHQGLLDSLFMASAIRNRRLNFVTTERFFRMKGVGALFRALGVIPRIQFHPDPRSIGAMLRVTQNGGAVGIFPAGQTSMCGVPGVISPSIVRLLKKSAATVVALNLHGGFFTKSRFADGPPFRGRVDARVSVLFTPQALEQADDETVYRAICQALDYDEYAWQQSTGVLFRAPARARGYEKVLFWCPKCGAEYRTQSQGHRFFCGACGNAAVVGPDMRMTAEDESCVIFPTLLQWYRAQEARLFGQIDDAEISFFMEAPVTAQLYQGTRRYDAGTGRLRLDRRGIYYEGTLSGAPVRLGVEHQNLPGMAAETGEYMELYDKDHGLVRYLPENPRMVTAFKMAQEHLYAGTLGGR